MKKIMLVFGTRPEAIKMAPLIKELKLHLDFFEVKICVTAQHREMLDQVLNLFEIEPDIDLNLMKKNQELSDITSSILLKMRDVIKKNRPDILFVHGDTTTTMSAALAAFYEKVTVAHIEAGLRTFNIRKPFPEELNRQIVSKISELHFAPTRNNFDNLINEGIKKENIVTTGNTVIDALFWALQRINEDPKKLQIIKDDLKKIIPFDISNKRFVLITGHRRENLGGGFIKICEAIKTLSKKVADVDFVYPVHLNPSVKTPVTNILGELQNVHLIQPLEYEKFVFLLSKSELVLTDSGGIQEEAPSLGKPVLVMRDVTERPEALKAGTVELVGSKKKKIINRTLELLSNKDRYKKFSLAKNPYGDGKASFRIVEFLLKRN